MEIFTPTFNPPGGRTPTRAPAPVPSSSKPKSPVVQKPPAVCDESATACFAFVEGSRGTLERTVKLCGGNSTEQSDFEVVHEFNTQQFAVQCGPYGHGATLLSTVATFFTCWLDQEFFT